MILDDCNLELDIDMSELDADIGQLRCGELTLPTVSAVQVLVNDTTLLDVPIFLA